MPAASAVAERPPGSYGATTTSSPFFDRHLLSSLLSSAVPGPMGWLAAPVRPAGTGGGAGMSGSIMGTSPAAAGAADRVASLLDRAEERRSAGDYRTGVDLARQAAALAE